MHTCIHTLKEAYVRKDKCGKLYQNVSYTFCVFWQSEFQRPLSPPTCIDAPLQRGCRPILFDSIWHLSVRVSADLRIGIQCNCDENYCKSFAIQQRKRRRDHTHVDACFSASFVAKCKICACAQSSKASRFGVHASQKLRFCNA